MAASDPTEQQKEEHPHSGEEHARRLRNSIISLLVLLVLIVALLLAVPGFRGVARQLQHARAGWIVAAVAFEFLSCVGYVLIFQRVFYRAPRRFAARLAWSEMAFQGAISLGGVSGVALGAWVLRTIGVPVARIVERSAVFFLATSAVNVFVLAVSGATLALGLSAEKHDVRLGLVPAAVGVAVLAFFLLLPGWAERRAERIEQGKVRSFLRSLARTVRETEHSLFARDWRVAGAFAYLLFDIACLWACFKALGGAPPIVPLIVGYQVGYLANIIPVPGGIGVLDAGLVGALVLYGVKATHATAAVLAYHAILLWVPTLIGTLAFYLLRRQLRRGEPIRPRVPERPEERPT